MSRSFLFRKWSLAGSLQCRKPRYPFLQSHHQYLLINAQTFYYNYQMIWFSFTIKVEILPPHWDCFAVYFQDYEPRQEICDYLMSLKSKSVKNIVSLLPVSYLLGKSPNVDGRFSALIQIYDANLFICLVNLLVSTFNDQFQQYVKKVPEAQNCWMHLEC